MHNIQHKLTQVLARIRLAAMQADRNPEKITLLAVSKKKTEQQVLAAYAAGQRHFGENYLQEAQAKIAAITQPDICWHFIGAIQSNKCRAIAANFSWVHSVNSLKVAQKLSQYRAQTLPPLNICLQVNIDREQSKAGIFPEQAPSLATAVSQLPNLCLRGLMAIPSASPAQQCPFVRMAELFANLKNNAQLANMDTLSMGMSSDLEQAITAGANLVRIGTAIFGERS